MASARASALSERRQSYNPYGTGARIRLLTSANNTIASIAKKAANNELDIMVKNYNAGQVSNADFRAFLAKMQGNPGISDVEKADITIQIKDFDSRVLGDTLTTAYKSAPDNSAQQLQAAQALSNYFKQRAGTFQPDTPAYSEAANNAAVYNDHVMTIQKNITTKARQNQRYVLEQEVNKIPSGTSESAAKKAEMWGKLYEQANNDGDVTAANQYAANYQQELTNAQTYSDKETASANKKKISDFINTTVNDYHSGKISGDEAIQQLQQADQFAADTGDTSSQIRMQSLYQTISREIDKGITYTADGGFGAKSKGGGTGGGDLYLNPDGSVTYGGGSTGTTSSGKKVAGPSVGTKVTPGGVGQKTTGKAPTKGGFTNGNDTPKTFDQLDIEYQNNLVQANKDLISGAIDAKKYKTLLETFTKSRQLDLQNITGGLGGILAANPNAKIGKTQIQTLQDKYTTELGNVTSEYNDIRTGRLVVGMQNSSFTDPTGKSINKQQLSLVPNSNKMINVNGVHYVPQEENLIFGSKNDALNYISQNKIKGKVTQDDNGKYVVLDEAAGDYAKGNVLHVNDTNGNDIVYQDEGNGYLPVGVGPKTAALRSRIAQERDMATKSGTEYKPTIMNYNDINKYDFSTPVTKLPPKPTVIDNVVNAAKSIAPKAPVTPPQVTPAAMPIERYASPSGGQISLPQNIGSGNFAAKISPEPLKLAGAPTQLNTQLKQTINPTGKTPIKVAAPPAGPTPAKQAAQIAQKAPDPNQYSVTNSLKKLANTLSFGLLKF